MNVSEIRIEREKEEKARRDKVIKERYEKHMAKHIEKQIENVKKGNSEDSVIHMNVDKKCKKKGNVY